MREVSLELVESLAREAGAILLKAFEARGRFDKKGSRDLVTEADRAAEAHLIQAIRALFPDHAILAEESAEEIRFRERQWIIDPLDGTTNFVYGIPHFAVSIAYCESGEPLIGVVFNPLTNECWGAQKGRGATRNGDRIQVRGESELSEALLATGLAYRRNEAADSNLEHIRNFAFACRCLRRMGSAASDLCYVADGRVDGYWELHLKPWDIAAGALIASEAGAEITSFAGGSDWLARGEVVAAPARLAAAMRGLIQSADRDRLAGPAFVKE